MTPFIFNIILEVLTTTITQELRGIQIGKEEVKLSLFAGDKIENFRHTENSKDVTMKLVEFISEFRKVAEHKINVQKSIH